MLANRRTRCQSAPGAEPTVDPPSAGVQPRRRLLAQPDAGDATAGSAAGVHRRDTAGRPANQKLPAAVPFRAACYAPGGRPIHCNEWARAADVADGAEYAVTVPPPPSRGG